MNKNKLLKKILKIDRFIYNTNTDKSYNNLLNYIKNYKINITRLFGK